MKCIFAAPLTFLLLSFPVLNGESRYQLSAGANGYETNHLISTVTQTDALTPYVVVLDPEGSTVTVHDEVLNFRILVLSSPKIPLTSVTVTNNGKTVSKVRLDKEVDQNRTKFLSEIQIVLQAGENLIGVIASNEKASSQPVIRKVNYQRPTSSKPNLIVLSVGVSDYKEARLSRPQAGADARAFAKLMNTQAGSEGIYGEVKNRLLVDGEVTRVEILKSLNWLNSEVRSNVDVRVLFLSGAFAADYGDNAYFLSADHQPKMDPEISSLNLRSIFARLADSGGPIIIFIDTNGFANSRLRLASELMSEYSHQENFLTYLCADAGESAETPASSAHSYFVTALLEGLNGQADLNLNGQKDGVVDSLELHFWLKSRVAALSGDRQHPTFLGNSRSLNIFKPAATQP